MPRPFNGVQGRLDSSVPGFRFQEAALTLSHEGILGACEDQDRRVFGIEVGDRAGLLCEFGMVPQRPPEERIDRGGGCVQNISRLLRILHHRDEIAGAVEMQDSPEGSGFAIVREAEKAGEMSSGGKAGHHDVLGIDPMVFSMLSEPCERSSAIGDLCREGGCVGQAIVDGDYGAAFFREPVDEVPVDPRSLPPSAPVDPKNGGAKVGAGFWQMDVEVKRAIGCLGKHMSAGPTVLSPREEWPHQSRCEHQHAEEVSVRRSLSHRMNEANLPTIRARGFEQKVSRETAMRVRRFGLLCGEGFSRWVRAQPAAEKVRREGGRSPEYRPCQKISIVRDPLAVHAGA